MYFHAYKQTRRLNIFSGAGDKQFLFFSLETADPKRKMAILSFYQVFAYFACACLNESVSTQLSWNRHGGRQDRGTSTATPSSSNDVFATGCASAAGSIPPAAAPSLVLKLVPRYILSILVMLLATTAADAEMASMASTCDHGCDQGSY